MFQDLLKFWAHRGDGTFDRLDLLPKVVDSLLLRQRRRGWRRRSLLRLALGHSAVAL